MKIQSTIFNYVLCLIIAITVAACKPTPEPEPAIVTTQGVCQPLFYKDANGVVFNSFEYDAAHHLTKWAGYNNSVPYVIYTVTYNALGRVATVKTKYNSANSGYGAISYDGNGNPSILENIDSNNVIQNKSLYFHDAQNRLIRQERYKRDTSGTMLQIDYFTCTYTGANRRPTRVDNFPTPTYTFYCIYEYDVNMNKTKVSQYQNGNMNAAQEDIFTYDNTKSIVSNIASFGRFIALPPENYHNGEKDKNNITSHITKSYNTDGSLRSTITNTSVYSNFNTNNYPLWVNTTYQSNSGTQTSIYNVEYACY